MRGCRHDSPLLEREIDEIAAAVSRAVDDMPCHGGAKLAAIVLGGGYGRSEGGILRLPDGGERLYNDLDLFVFVDNHMSAGAARIWREELDRLGAALSQEHHVEVEFGPLTRLGDLKKLSATLMYQELRLGWRPVWGDCAAVIAMIRPIPLNRLPKSEGLRLLLNRGAGLLMSQQKLESVHFDREAADFVNRNQNKAAQAVGDAFLIARGGYLQHGPERLNALEHEPDFSETALISYRAALEFKYAPSAEPPPREVLAARQKVVVNELLDEFADFLAHGGGRYDGTFLNRLRDLAKSILFFRFFDIKHLFFTTRLRLSGILIEKLVEKNSDTTYIIKKLDRSYRRLVEKSGSLTTERFIALWQRMN
ncbi:MAG: hypothetical protein PHI35_04560 [Victivallaceae bacterium]|nr:hypothetical protein [Victivallaceae bacterium]